MSELKILTLSSTDYRVDDSIVRAILDTYPTNTAAKYIPSADTTLSTSAIPEVQAVITYLTNAITAKKPFRYKFYESYEDLPTASSSTEGELAFVKKATTETGNVYDEYITINTGTVASPVYKWELVGTTGVKLVAVTNLTYDTTTRVISQVKDGTTTTVATLGKVAPLSSIDITGNIADVSAVTPDEASITSTASLTEGTEVNAYTVSTSETYTPSGSFTKGSVTPSGTISLHDFSTSTADASTSTTSFTPAGTVTATLTKGSANADVTKDDFTPAGTVTATAPTVNNLMADVGSLATYSAHSFTAATLTPTASTYKSQAIKVSMDTTDTEMLVIENASTATIISSATLTPDSMADDTFDEGTLPTKASTITPAVDTSTFSGTAASLASTITYQKATALSAEFAATNSQVVPDATKGIGYKAVAKTDPTFTGNAMSGNTISPSWDNGPTYPTAVTYDKASTVSFSTTASVSGSFTRTAKTISLSKTL